MMAFWVTLLWCTCALCARAYSQNSSRNPWVKVRGNLATLDIWRFVAVLQDLLSPLISHLFGHDNLDKMQPCNSTEDAGKLRGHFCSHFLPYSPHCTCTYLLGEVLLPPFLLGAAFKATQSPCWVQMVQEHLIILWNSPLPHNGSPLASPSGAGVAEAKEFPVWNMPCQQQSGYSGKADPDQKTSHFQICRVCQGENISFNLASPLKQTLAYLNVRVKPGPFHIILQACF